MWSTSISFAAECSPAELLSKKSCLKQLKIWLMRAVRVNQKKQPIKLWAMKPKR